MLCDSHFRISTQYFALLPQGLNPIFSSLSLPPLFAGFLSHSKSSLGWDFPRKTGSHLVQIHCKSPRLLFFVFFWPFSFFSCFEICFGMYSCGFVFACFFHVCLLIVASGVVFVWFIFCFIFGLFCGANENTHFGML